MKHNKYYPIKIIRLKKLSTELFLTFLGCEHLFLINHLIKLRQLNSKEFS